MGAPHVGVLMHCAAENCERMLLRGEEDQATRQLNEVSGRWERHWTCACGHNNVKPLDKSLAMLQAEAEEANTYLRESPLMKNCFHDNIDFPTRRICEECWTQDKELTFCEHAGGCKHWPENHGEHHHVFCYGCLRPWHSVYENPPAGKCNHRAGSSCRQENKAMQQLTVVEQADGTITTGITY